MKTAITSLLASGPYLPSPEDLVAGSLLLFATVSCFALFIYGLVQFFAKRRWEKGVILCVVSILVWLLSIVLLRLLFKSTS